LLKKQIPFQWTEKCEEAFQTLKERLISPPILGHFNPKDNCILYTDASNYAIGAVLAQVQDGQERIICYISKTLNAAQMKYGITEKEMLSLVYSVLKLREYLFGAHFTVKVDHCSLCYLLKISSPSGRLTRWALLLQEFDFTVEYKSGKTHTNADCLSRLKINNGDVQEPEFPVMFNVAIDVEQSNDNWCKSLIEALKRNSTKKFLKKFKLQDKTLYRITYHRDGCEKLLLCVPKKLRLDVLNQLHDNASTGGHYGLVKTYLKVRERFYWPNLEKSIGKYIARCKSCQLNKPDYAPSKGLLQNIPYQEPFSLLGLDLLGPINETSRGNKYIIVVINLSTKYLESAALKYIRSKTMADYLINSIFLRHGAIASIITDQGRSLVSNLMNDVMRQSGVNHITTTAYHPQSNGQAERTCKIIIDLLSHYVEEDLRNWDLILPSIVFCYNTTVQASTRETPFKLLYGREANLPIDLNLNLTRFKVCRDYRQLMEETRDLVKQRILEAQEKQKNEYDERHRHAEFEESDMVALYTPVRKVGTSEKLLKKFSGPWTITKKHSRLVYTIQNVENPARSRKVHIQRLKRWHSDYINELDNNNTESDAEDPDLDLVSDGFGSTEEVHAEEENE